MHPDLQSLLHLQEKDRVADAVIRSLDALKPEEKALDDEMEQMSRILAEAQRSASGAEARKVELQGRIAGYKQLQERRRQQLDFTRTPKETSTLTAEIDLARSVLIKEESDFLRSGDAIVEAEKKVKDAEKAHEAGVERQAETRTVLALKRAGLQEELTVARAARQEATKDVRPDLLVRYERIRRGRAPAAVFPLRNDSCGHCFTSVPMQRRVLIQQGQVIEACEVCGVLLYAEG